MRTTAALALACSLALTPATLLAAEPVAPAVRLLLPDAQPRNAYATPRDIGGAVFTAGSMIGSASPGVIASPLLARRPSERLLDACLLAIETQEFGAPRLEAMLDDDTLSDEDADRLAVRLETDIPAWAARACVVLASVYERDRPDLARALATAGLEYASLADAGVLDATLSRAHALRHLGRYDEALRAYAEARSQRSATSRRGLIGIYDFEGETLIGAARAARGAGVVDDAGLLRMLDDLWNERPFSMEPGMAVSSTLVTAWRMRAADVAFMTLRGAGAPTDELGAAHDRVVRACYADDRVDDRAWGVGLVSLAEAATVAGGMTNAEALPLPLLLALAGDNETPIGERRRAATAAFERAEEAGRDNEPLWDESAFLFGAYGVDAREQDPGLRVAAVDALLRTLETPEPQAPRRTRGVLRQRLHVWDVPLALRDRWLALVRQGMASGDAGGVREAAQSLLAELVRRSPAWDAQDARAGLEEGRGAVARSDDLLVRALLMRLHTYVLRLVDMGDDERTRLAQETLRTSESVRDAITAEERGPSVPTDAAVWPLHAADALLVLGRADEALALLDEHSRPLLRTGATRVRLVAHANAMLGDEAAALAAFGSFPPNASSLTFPGAPFERDREGASALARSFVGDAHEATERDRLLASYAVIDAGLAERWRQALSTEDALRNAARLVRVGRTEEALALLDAYGANEAPARLLRGEAHLRGGDEASAFAVFRELATALGATAEWRASREHWHAWARMLEILDGQNADGSRTQAITDGVRRLRALPSWGEWPNAVRRIESVAR